MSYWKFIRQDWPLIGFGFLMAFLTAPGQTFFIGIFRDSLAEAFDLSLGQFGQVYSAVSLASAAIFLWSGKLIDEWPIRKVTLVFVLTFAASALLLAGSFHLVMLVLALFGVRHLGQGLMGHVSSTTMARYFVHNRAKAISLSALGYAFNEAFVPILGVSLLAVAGWRISWVVVAFVVLLIFLPLSLWLLKMTHRDLSLERQVEEEVERVGDLPHQITGRDMTRGEVLRDWRFWCLIPVHVSSSYFLTGIFLNQASLAGELGISMSAIAICFSGFAVANMVSTVLIGPLVDRFGYLLPYVIGYFLYFLAMVSLGFSGSFLGGLLFYSSVGFALGIMMPAAGAMWPGLYGVRHLGAIKSLIMAFTVLSAGLAPASFGFFIDRGVEVRTLGISGAFYALIVIVPLVLFVVSEIKRERALASS